MVVEISKSIEYPFFLGIGTPCWPKSFSKYDEREQSSSDIKAMLHSKRIRQNSLDYGDRYCDCMGHPLGSLAAWRVVSKMLRPSPGPQNSAEGKVRDERTVTVLANTRQSLLSPICCTSRGVPIEKISISTWLRVPIVLTLGKFTLGTMTEFRADGASLTLASLPGEALVW
jgi:hypothetical protein